MPDFIGIGAQKAGTTWLYKLLREHPTIGFPAGKEIHFWNQNQQRGLNWYLSLFETETEQIQGDITPAYSILEKPKVLEIRRAFPNARIIYLVRNPIERAWSSALMALHRAEMKPHEASDQWFKDHFYSEGSIKRGDYQACLETWLSCYPESQVGVYFFEQILSEPVALIKEVCAHINISHEPFIARNSELLYTKVRPVPAQAVEPIRPSLLPDLQAIYHTKIKRFAKFMGISLHHWLI